MNKDFTGSSFFFLLLGLLLISTANAFSQNPYQSNGFTQPPPNQNYLSNSTAFRQEIARLEINVVRPGKAVMPITEVPRLQKGDILKVRMIDEPVNGLKPDQSNYDWTFLVAFINPGRNTDRESSLSEEIRFRKTGWYKEYSFNVPYDSQPVFFIYPKPEYRTKILNLISKNQDEIRKIGEKTIEISSAYAKIGTFLNELQSVVNRSQQYQSYGNYGGYYGGNGNGNQSFFMEQTVERLARSFNINLPNCWTGGSNNYNGYNNYGGYNTYGTGNDFTGRVQCIAKSVRLEDFDLSVSRMLQQGGILAAAQLSQKYPQLAFWINIAAVALDFILKITNKTPLKLVPTVITTSEYRAPNDSNQNSNVISGSLYANSLSSGAKSSGVKISLFAESSPNDNGFVTAYPLVVHKWQADSDPEVINLPAPVLAEACLREGQNLLRNTDLMSDWLGDSFTKSFRLLVVSSNGFRREFPLTKNGGLGGWELNLTKDDLNDFSKTGMPLEGVVAGKRGFNEVRSLKFELPVVSPDGWIIEPQQVDQGSSKRVVIIKNRAGCRCLKSVVYKPQNGGQTVFGTGDGLAALNFSSDGSQASFELNVAQNGTGQIELRLYSGEVATLSLNLYPPQPVITDLKIARGDKQAVVYGSGLEQIQTIKINGKRAIPVSSNTVPSENGQDIYGNTYSNLIQGNNRSASLSTVQRIFAFDDPTQLQDSGSVSLEIELEGSRVLASQTIFSVSPSRPSILAGLNGEVSAFVEDSPKSTKIIGRPAPATGLDKSVFLPAAASKISFSVQNALTDYDFKTEKVNVEIRVENGGIINAPDLEVLDWKTLRISVPISEELGKLLPGKRLQFRIRDIERGHSDWYTIKQRFVRTPEIASVKCNSEIKSWCELKGTGIGYIYQVSVDGGKTWLPIINDGLTAKSNEKGQEVVKIPYYSNKNFLRIRLSDFPEGAGISVSDYTFTQLRKK